MSQETAALIIFLFTLGIGALMSVSMNKRSARKKTTQEQVSKINKFKVINGGKNE